MREVLVCEPVRTAVGRYGGSLKSLSAAELLAPLIRGLVERTSLDANAISDVIVGQCYPNGEAPAIGRVAALDAGLPVEVPGMQLDRRCGSGLMAVLVAAAQVQSGMSNLVLAGGVESMSQAEHYSTELRWGTRSGDSVLHDRLARGRVTAGGIRFPSPGGMIETAENLRAQFGISREAQDQLALSSHKRSVDAIRSGRFTDEIIPLDVQGRVVATDEHPRADVSLEALAALQPVMAKQDPDATVTAGNSSGQNDGAAVCIVADSRSVEAHGLRPMGRLVAAAVSGVDPRYMGIGPVPAIAAVLERSSLTLDRMDLIELNEAFAAQVLACTEALRLGEDDFERLNVNGSGISLGHPVGATGARVLATMLRELRRRGGRYALETLCIGGGQGIAAIFEAV
jgi:acetyl-CoA C-acetyltransferase